MSEKNNTNSVDWTRLGAVGALALVLCSLVLVPGVGTATAANDSTSSTTESLNDTAPYYDDQDSNVSFDSWMEGRETPSLSNVTHYLTRVSGFIIGYDTADGGSGGPAGVMITALIMFGAFIGATAGVGVGPVGGATISMVAAAGLSAAGIAPVWMYGIAVFGLALVVVRVIINAMQ
jgi:hypothetical protein